MLYASVGYESPLLIFGFFLVSTIINKFVMSPIASLVFKQEAKEGDFRLSIVILVLLCMMHNNMLDFITFKLGVKLNRLPSIG